MRIHLIAVGKLKERCWRDACDEYIKRIRRYSRIDVTEFDDRDPARHGGQDRARASEATDVRRALAPSGPRRCVVCMDPAGSQLDSEGIAALIEGLQTSGCTELDIVIGGPVGIDADLKREADRVVSLGRITMPHNIARVVVLEQIYRAFKIIKGEPYHR